VTDILDTSKYIFSLSRGEEIVIYFSLVKPTWSEVVTTCDPVQNHCQFSPLDRSLVVVF